MTATALRCSKHRYRTLGAAEDALLSCRIKKALRGNGRRRETRAYLCRTCRGWHLTSQLKNTP